MILVVMGAPAFVSRLISVYSLKHEFLFNQTLKVINSLHQNKGFVVFLISSKSQWQIIHALKYTRRIMLVMNNYLIPKEVFKPP